MQFEKFTDLNLHTSWNHTNICVYSIQQICAINHSYPPQVEECYNYLSAHHASPGENVQFVVTTGAQQGDGVGGRRGVYLREPCQLVRPTEAAVFVEPMFQDGVGEWIIDVEAGSVRRCCEFIRVCYAFIVETILYYLDFYRIELYKPLLTLA